MRIHSGNHHLQELQRKAVLLPVHLKEHFVAVLREHWKPKLFFWISEEEYIQGHLYHSNY